MTDPITTDARLFGVPGAEEMHQDLASAYESQIEPWADGHEHDRGSRQLEEWTAVPLGNALPSADRVIEWMAEWADDEVTEAAADCIDDAGKHPEVVAAVTAALDVWASKITYTMAEKLVRTLEITWDAAGEPLADGEPIYRRTTT